MKKLMFLPALGALFPVAMIAQSGTVEHDASGGEGLAQQSPCASRVCKPWHGLVGSGF